MTTELTNECCTPSTVSRNPRARVHRYTPKVDILESDSDVRLFVEMPGVNAEGVDLRFEDGVLTIEGTVQPRQTQGTKYLHREYGTGNYFRRFEVSDGIQADSIAAEIKDGVLTVTLPKAEAARPRKIEVQAG